MSTLAALALCVLALSIGTARARDGNDDVDGPGCVLPRGAYETEARRRRLNCSDDSEDVAVCGTSLQHIMDAQPRRGDSRVALAKQYAAAVLNQECGVPDADPNSTDTQLIEDAGTFLNATCNVDLTARTSEHDKRAEALYFAEQLDLFNNANRSVPTKCNLTEILGEEELEGDGNGLPQDDEDDILDNLFVGRHGVHHIEDGNTIDAGDEQSSADTVVVSVALTVSVAAVTTFIVLVYA